MHGDILRFLVFIASAATVGLAITTVLSYARVYVLHRKAVHAGTEAEWRGLLPLHVALIGFAYLTLVLMSVVDTAGRVNNDEVSWRLYVYAAANAIGAYALWIILRNSRYRKTELGRKAGLSDGR